LRDSKQRYDAMIVEPSAFLFNGWLPVVSAGTVGRLSIVLRLRTGLAPAAVLDIQPRLLGQLLPNRKDQTAMPTMTFLLSVAWSLTTIVLFFWAIRLSYRIEARSPLLVNPSGVPRYAALFHTITNSKVARDPETQRLRRRMNMMLAVILAGFVLFATAVALA
jgi:hypothetical protein